MALVQFPVPNDDDNVVYPETDGKPMAEGDAQRIAMMYLIEVLYSYFEPIKDVYVSGNILVYYEKGDNTLCFSPDVLIACEVEKRKRPIYQIWKEGKAPDVIIEVTSKSTRREDEHRKAQLYLDLGVCEYYQYDPTADYIPGGLKGRMNIDGKWEPITPLKIDRMSLALECTSLELTFCVDFENNIHVWSQPEQRFLPGSRELRQINTRLVGVKNRLELEKLEIEEEKTKVEEEKAKVEEKQVKTEWEKAKVEEKLSKAEQEKAKAEQEVLAMKEKLKALGLL